MSAYYKRVSPAYVFLGVVTLGIVMSLMSLLVALMQPQIDLPQGAKPTQIGSVAIIASDFVEEPDKLGSNEAIRAFRARQTLIRKELNAPKVSVRFQMPDGTSGASDFTVRSRQIADLPWIFWFQIGVGMVSLMIGGWVISLRPYDWGARMFALTAFFMPVSTLSAAVYSTRQIALDGALFHTLSAINGLGAIAFGVALIGLFSQYPKSLFRLSWMLIPAGLYGIAAVMHIFTIGIDNAIGLSVLSQMLVALILGAVQWFSSRREPLNRAGLRWFILVSLSGCSLFIALSVAPAILGLTEAGYVPQGIAFAFFNIMHVGLALGIMRYKMFNLERWSYYIWLWLAGMVLIFVLDVLLIRFLQGQPWVSLGVALLISGFVYFPLRQLLLKLLLRRKQATLKGRMAEIVGVALSPTSREHALRWDELLTNVFTPLAPPEITAQLVDTPQLSENGLALLIPGVAGLEPRRLWYAQRGRRLFSRDDIEVAANMIQMHDLATESRHSFERGITLERDRISRDVHDNIGAQLLSALHSREVARKDDLLRDSLTDLRSIINDGFQAEFDLLPLLSDLRTETTQRFEAANIALNWTTSENSRGEDGPAIPFELVNGLRSILREAVSNILRHSGAKNVWIEAILSSDEIALNIEDDGKGLTGKAKADQGNGIPNIMDRAAVLMGTCHIGARIDGQKGAQIRVTLPLCPADRRNKETVE